MTWGVSCIENDIHGTSWMVQWLRRQASNSRGSGLIPDGAIKILHARRPKQTNKQHTVLLYVEQGKYVMIQK